MSEDIDLVLEDTTERMEQCIKHFESELTKIRAGKANPQMLAGITVDYYGTRTPLNQVANVGTTDAKTIVIQPWEKAMLEVIEKEIHKANLGFNPMNNGEIIRIIVPPLTEERRRDLVKQVKTEAENTKVAIRNVRRDNNVEVKKLQKQGVPEDEAKLAEEKIQKLTDSYIEQVDKIMLAKEKEIMTV